MIEKHNSKDDGRVSLDSNKYSQDTMSEIHDWCFAVFGSGGRKEEYRWRYGWNSEISKKDFFYFKHEQDTVMFALKWA